MPLTATTRRRLTLAAWLVTTALLAVALRLIGPSRAASALQDADLGWLAVAVVADTTILALWTWQTQVLLGGTDHRLSYRRLFAITTLSTTATNTAPLFVGEAASVAILAERGGLGVALSLSLLAQHQVVEGLAKLAMLFAAARVAPLPDVLRNAIGGLVAGIALLAALLFAVARLHARRTPDGGAVGRTNEPPIPASRVAHFLERLGGSVRLWSPGRFTVATAIALAMKAAEGLAWVAVERAFHIAPTPGSAVLALAAVNMASSISLTPGNLGVYEAAAYAAYVSLGVPRDTALGVAIAGHLAYLLPFVGIGYLVLTRAEWRAMRARR